MNKIEKTAYYYKIICNNNLIQTKPTLYQYLINVNTDNPYKIKFKDKFIKIEVCSIDNNYLFGRCVKEEDIDNNFLRKYNQNDNNFTKFELEKYECLETFTYFCIKFKKYEKEFDKMISLSNKKIKNIDKILELFIKKISIISNIEIIQESVDDLENKLQTSNIKKINLKLFNENIENDYSPLKDILNRNNLIKDFALTITLNKNKNLWKDIKDLFKSNYKKASIEICTFDNIEEHIDILKNTFTKKYYSILKKDLNLIRTLYLKF